jgi:hypothetical protein
VERLGPRLGRELADEALWMRGHPEEHVLEVVERRDINQLATLNEGIEERSPTSAFEARDASSS